MPSSPHRRSFIFHLSTSLPHVTMAMMMTTMTLMTLMMLMMLMDDVDNRMMTKAICKGMIPVIHSLGEAPVSLLFRFLRPDPILEKETIHKCLTTSSVGPGILKLNPKKKKEKTKEYERRWNESNKRRQETGAKTWFQHP